MPNSEYPCHGLLQRLFMRVVPRPRQEDKFSRGVRTAPYLHQTPGANVCLDHESWCDSNPVALNGRVQRQGRAAKVQNAVLTAMPRSLRVFDQIFPPAMGILKQRKRQERLGIDRPVWPQATALGSSRRSSRTNPMHFCPGRNRLFLKWCIKIY